MASKLVSALKILLPGKGAPGGVSVTTTFNASNTGNILAIPTYRDHLHDIFASRTSDDSRALVKSLFKNDPDVSASVNAFLTVANTELVMLAKDANGELDMAGQQALQSLVIQLTTRQDYSKGFKIVNSLSNLAENCRMLLLMRGAVGGELIMSKEMFPVELRLLDMGKVEWFEVTPGAYTPRQRTLTGEIISLDIPTFFTTWFRRDPSEIYSYSPFISAINTIAARQQVINDLYRIMKVTGYPRMEITVLEEVLMKSAPEAARRDIDSKQAYLNQQLGSIRSAISTLRPDQAFVHTDSMTMGVVNQKSPGMAMDIGPIISALNAQNQAGLKTMATIIGRGEAGVNTASVEARIFAMNAQALNEPVADLLSQVLTLALRFTGSESHVECYFKPVEMRSDTELETQMLVRSQRLKDDLSLGLITDAEYHLMVYNRLPPPGSPVLSGTGFAQGGTAGVDISAVSPNGDPVGRAASAPRGNAGARDNKSKPASATKR